MDIFSIVWLSGLVVAFILCVLTAHNDSRNGKNIDDFCAVTPVVCIFSWIGAIFMVSPFIKSREK